MLPVVYRGLHIPQAQSLHGGAVSIIALQRHQRAPGRHDGVPQRRRHGIAVAGGAGAGIGHAAGSQYHGVRRAVLPVGIHAGDCAVRHGDRRRPLPEEADVQPPKLTLQRAGDVEGAVRHREHAVSPLHLQRHTQRLEKRHGILRCKAGQGAVQEPAVAGDIGHQRLLIAVVGHVAPALAGDIQFFAQPLVGLQQRHTRTLPGGGDGRHHTGGASADHYDLTHRPLSRRCCTSTTPVPYPPA